MENRKNYHEEQNKLNTVKMRNVLSELPRSVNNSSVELRTTLPPEQDLLMLMI